MKNNDPIPKIIQRVSENYFLQKIIQNCIHRKLTFKVRETLTF